MSRPDKHPLVSIVVPAYNEAAGIEQFYASLRKVLAGALTYRHEIIFINDGSTDNTLDILHAITKKDERVRLLCLSRNFGKEVATTAGINNAKGDALIILDADGQHPVELIPKFIGHWEAGNNVVVGVRTQNQKEGFLKKYGSGLFYRLFNATSDMKLVPGSTDYRLIDRSVQQEFIRMTERNRITRGLIDWLGYRRNYIYFKANERMAGEATYSFKKLLKLAVNSTISLSTTPLYFAAYIGAAIVPFSILLGLFMLAEQLLGDPLALNITGTAYLVVLVMLLVGLLLISQGIMALYLSHIHAETQNRPLYLIDHRRSVRSTDHEHEVDL